MERLFHDRSGWLYGGLVSIVAFATCINVGWLRNGGHWDKALRNSNDANGYYEFLPAAFSKHDLDSMAYAIPAADGRTLNVQHMGVALLEMPFFLAAHVQVSLSGGFATGWTSPYAKARVQASAAYCALGLLFIFLLLRRRFVDPISAGTALLLLGGTNLLYYSSVEPGYSHAYSFFLFAWLLWLTPRLIQQPTRGRIIALFTCAALILLVRPMNAPVLLYPVLVRSGSARDVLKRLRDWSRQRAGIVIGVLMAIAIWAPQLWYWHRVTGSWLTFTYGHKNEYFNWSEFHGFDVLFSHQNGWFIYSPFMLPVMGALGIMAWRKLEGARMVLLIWVITWLTYSFWWCWWLGGSFGFRGFIELGALLAVPLAWWIERSLRHAWSSVLLAVVVVLCVHINLVFTELYDWPWEGDTWNWERVRHIYRVAFLE